MEQRTWMKRGSPWCWAQRDVRNACPRPWICQGRAIQLDISPPHVNQDVEEVIGRVSLVLDRLLSLSIIPRTSPCVGRVSIAAF